MSRVGSKEINIPESVKINLQDGLISAEGPLGKLESKLNSQIEVIIEGHKITMKPKSDDKTLVSFWGLQRIVVAEDAFNIYMCISSASYSIGGK